MTTPFATALKQHRLKAGLNVARLSMLSGVSRPQIYRLENGERGATFATVCALADAIGIDVDSLRTKIAT